MLESDHIEIIKHKNAENKGFISTIHLERIHTLKPLHLLHHYKQTRPLFDPSVFNWDFMREKNTKLCINVQFFQFRPTNSQLDVGLNFD